MVCSLKNPCPEGDYCDAHVFKCTTCDVFCSTVELWEDCRVKCPETWRIKSEGHSSTQMSEGMHATTHSTDAEVMSTSFLIILLVLVVLVIAFIIALVVYCIHKKGITKCDGKVCKKYPEGVDPSMSSPNSNEHPLLPMEHGNLVEKKDGEASIKYSNELTTQGVKDYQPVGEEGYHNLEDYSYRSLMGSTISQPTDALTHNHDEIVKKGINVKEKSTCNSINEQTATKLSDVTDTECMISEPDESMHLTDNIGISPHNSDHVDDFPQTPVLLRPVMLHSVTGYRPSDLSIAAQSSINDNNDTVSSGGSELDLQSSDELSPSPLHQNDELPQTYTDSREPFRHVMRAYDAFDEHLPEMSFARGCLIANDELRVFVSDRRDQGECYDRVMNIMPSDVPVDVVAVQPETPML